ERDELALFERFEERSGLREHRFDSAPQQDDGEHRFAFRQSAARSCLSSAFASARSPGTGMSTSRSPSAPTMIRSLRLKYGPPLSMYAGTCVANRRSCSVRTSSSTA